MLSYQRHCESAQKDANGSVIRSKTHFRNGNTASRARARASRATAASILPGQSGVSRARSFYPISKGTRSLARSLAPSFVHSLAPVRAYLMSGISLSRKISLQRNSLVIRITAPRVIARISRTSVITSLNVHSDFDGCDYSTEADGGARVVESESGRERERERARERERGCASLAI